MPGTTILPPNTFRILGLYVPFSLFPEYRLATRPLFLGLAEGREQACREKSVWLLNAVGELETMQRRLCRAAARAELGELRIKGRTADAGEVIALYRGIYQDPVPASVLLGPQRPLVFSITPRIRGCFGVSAPLADPLLAQARGPAALAVQAVVGELVRDGSLVYEVAEPPGAARGLIEAYRLRATSLRQVALFHVLSLHLDRTTGNATMQPLRPGPIPGLAALSELRTIGRIANQLSAFTSGAERDSEARRAEAAGCRYLDGEARSGGQIELPALRHMDEPLRLPEGDLADAVCQRCAIDEPG